MLSKKMISLLSEQVKNEFESAYLYLIAADYFHSEGLPGFASWYINHSKEEVEHAMIFYDYIHKNNERVQFFNLEPTRTIYSSLTKPLEDTIVHEDFITTCINQIYEVAAKEKDYRTTNFLTWFITEQQEEEENAHANMDKLNLFGNNPAGLYLLDKEMGNRYGKHNKGE